MAMTPCRECGQPVSTGANHCPRCGANNPGLDEGARSVLMVGLLISFTVIVFLFVATIW